MIYVNKLYRCWQGRSWLSVDMSEPPPPRFLPALADNSCGIPLYTLPDEDIPLNSQPVYIVRKGFWPGIFTHE
jgi:hypothetical protein